MGLLDWLFPKEKDFYKMLTEQSAITVKGMNLFCEYMCSSSDISVQQIVDVEHEGDSARRLLIDDLNKTFITPIEREDIFSLSRTVDDILDKIKSAVEEFSIYKLAPNDFLKSISRKIIQSIEHLHEAISLLKEHPAISIEKCTSAKEGVDEVEELYYKALAELTESDDVKYMFKMGEIYRHFLQVGSRVDDAANIILDIIVKTT
jgi:predicted phosphate transport protein (TIGR00153 family)